MFLADKTTVADEKLIGKSVICIQDEMMPCEGSSSKTGKLLEKNKIYTVVKVEQKGKCDRENAFFPEGIDTWIVTKEDREGRWSPERFILATKGGANAPSNI